MTSPLGKTIVPQVNLKISAWGAFSVLSVVPIIKEVLGSTY